MEDIIINSVGGNPIVGIVIQESTSKGFDIELGIKKHETIIYVPLDKVFIRKKAMSSGKASVTLYSSPKKGLHIGLETSATLLRQIADIIDNLQ